MKKYTYFAWAAAFEAARWTKSTDTAYEAVQNMLNAAYKAAVAVGVDGEFAEKSAWDKEWATL